ncbi:MAG TPA: BLUF domain-containing protein, partial [Acetobacteraceae bacterium]
PRILTKPSQRVKSDGLLVPEHRVPVELPRILDAARRWNLAQGITGALLFSADGFVQVLEGPMAAVERTFERIQCDPRHADVVVLEAGTLPARDFAGWSMAYAGRRPDLRFEGFGAAPDGAPMAMLDLLRGTLGRLVGTAIPA